MALVAVPSDTDEASQSLLLTQAQGSQQQRCLAGAQSNEEDSHGGEGRRPAKPAAASRPSAREQHPLLPSTVGKLSVTMKHKRAKKKGLLPPKKLSSMSKCLTVEQGQMLGDFFAVNPIFYDQTRKDFKDRGKRKHLLGVIGAEICITCKSTFC